jgi:hypothetical protein
MFVGDNGATNQVITGSPPTGEMELGAQILEIIRELQEDSFEPGISIKQLTTRFAEQHGEEYEAKITPYWIGHLVRKKLACGQRSATHLLHRSFGSGK